MTIQQVILQGMVLAYFAIQTGDRSKVTLKRLELVMSFMLKCVMYLGFKLAFSHLILFPFLPFGEIKTKQKSLKKYINN